jgi:proline racemase
MELVNNKTEVLRQAREKLDTVRPNNDDIRSVSLLLWTEEERREEGK